MPEWMTVQLTSMCQPEASTILLPKGSTAGGRVLLKKGTTERMLHAGVRNDTGTGACVDASLLAAFGEGDVTVEYRTVGLPEAIVRDRWLAIQGLISLLTVVSTGIAGYLTFLKNDAEKVGSFAHETAFIALVVASLLSFLKTWKEFNEL